MTGAIVGRVIVGEGRASSGVHVVRTVVFAGAAVRRASTAQ